MDETCILTRYSRVCGQWSNSTPQVFRITFRNSKSWDSHSSLPRRCSMPSAPPCSTCLEGSNLRLTAEYVNFLSPQLGFRTSILGTVCLPLPVSSSIIPNITSFTSLLSIILHNYVSKQV